MGGTGITSAFRGYVIRLALFSLVITAVPLTAGAAAPQGGDLSIDLHGVNIDFHGQVMGTLDRLRIESGNDPVTLMVRLEATLALSSFVDGIDRALSGRQNMLEACSRRLYWVGGTSLRHYGTSLGLSSRVRYEQWICGFLGDNRIFRDTKTVDWRLFVEADRFDRIQASAQVENVRNLQNDVERLLGVRVREDIAIPLEIDCGGCACNQMADTTRLAVESVRFKDGGDGVIGVIATFSVAGGPTVIAEIMKCYSEGE